MVAQCSGIGRALTGRIRSAGKSSVPEIANLSHSCTIVRWFEGFDEGVNAAIFTVASCVLI